MTDLLCPVCNKSILSTQSRVMEYIDGSPRYIHRKCVPVDLDALDQWIHKTFFPYTNSASYTRSDAAYMKLLRKVRENTEKWDDFIYEYLWDKFKRAHQEQEHLDFVLYTILDPVRGCQAIKSWWEGK